MTNLSERIAALTGPDREIDAEVADLLGWWPKGFTRIDAHGRDRRWKALRGKNISTEHVDCPNYTASLDVTLAEIRRRGWRFMLYDYCGMASFSIIYLDSEVRLADNDRTDDNLSLVALEALVKAIEGTTNDPELNAAFDPCDGDPHHIAAQEHDSFWASVAWLGGLITFAPVVLVVIGAGLIKIMELCHDYAS
jgi:hypothetical protein